MSVESPWVDVIAIQDLVCRERYWRDRADWEALRSAYTDDARVRVTWFDGSIDDYIEKSRHPDWDPGSLSTHRLSPSVVTVHGDRALAETPTRVELRFDVGGILCDAVVSVRLLSRVVRTPGGWKLAGMDAIYEKDVVRPVHPADHVAISSGDTAPYRDSYRFLAFGAGGRMPDDIPGDDRPELVTALYEAADAWLRSECRPQPSAVGP